MIGQGSLASIFPADWQWNAPIGAPQPNPDTVGAAVMSYGATGGPSVGRPGTLLLAVVIIGLVGIYYWTREYQV